MLRVALQMDDPAGFKPATDSTLLLGLEAQARGHSLHYYLPRDLSYGQGRLTAPARPIRFFDDASRWYEAGDVAPLDLATQDVILMRQDPPYDMAYLSACWLLEQLPASVAIYNPPAYVRSYPEKLAILHFADFIPPTLISRDLAAIESFRRTHGAIIVKPLYGYGGRAVMLFTPDDGNLPSYLEQVNSFSSEPLMIQPFLSEVAQHDRRVLMVDGEVISVIGRIPAAGEVRANFRVGGTAAAAELTPRQRTICDAVGAQLKAHRVMLAGLDLIGDTLTEINITSPTGLRAALNLYGTHVAAVFWDAVERATTAS